MDPIEDYARDMLMLLNRIYSTLAYSGTDFFREYWRLHTPHETPYSAWDVENMAQTLWQDRPQPNPLAYLREWVHTLTIYAATSILDAIEWHIEEVRRKRIPVPRRSIDEMEALRQCLLAYANAMILRSNTSAPPTRRRRSKSPDS